MKHSEFLTRLNAAQKVYEMREEKKSFAEIAAKLGLSRAMWAGTMAKFYADNRDKARPMWSDISHATVLRWSMYCPARNVEELKAWLTDKLGVRDKIMPYYSGKLNQSDLREMLSSIGSWTEGVEWFEHAKVGEATTKLYVHWRQVK